MRHFLVTRDVTPDECGWLDDTVKRGTRVAAYHGCTYGCISGTGRAVTMAHDGSAPFFELPENSLEEESA